jgi:hypothetical protein
MKALREHLKGSNGLVVFTVGIINNAVGECQLQEQRANSPASNDSSALL